MSCEDAGADKFNFGALEITGPARPECLQADGCPDIESAEAAIAEMVETTKEAVGHYVCPDDQLWGV